jgi:hypothetical protein
VDVSICRKYCDTKGYLSAPVDYQKRQKKWNNLKSEAKKKASDQKAELCKTGRGGPTATLDDETTKILSPFLDDTELPSPSDSESSLVSSVSMKYDTFLGTIIRRDVS